MHKNNGRQCTNLAPDTPPPNPPEKPYMFINKDYSLFYYDDWKPCEYCRKDKILYQETRYEKLFIDSFGKHRGLLTEFKKCPPYVNCSRKDMCIGSMFLIKYCPECGRPLTEEAWRELAERLGMYK